MIVLMAAREADTNVKLTFKHGKMVVSQTFKQGVHPFVGIVLPKVVVLGMLSNDQFSRQSWIGCALSIGLQKRIKGCVNPKGADRQQTLQRGIHEARVSQVGKSNGFKQGIDHLTIFVDFLPSTFTAKKKHWCG